ncbi:alpha-ribazole phosphatase family protein [Flammeovirga agarivorans]|uniref:phosphoglycerate mutase (2,3-diphosphoglycerate-dependent) n=1 Tax=Flammeovirga agarivorans TaxID=2726742 RepID=A0A7X8XZ70_9BACT|nr:alpha-ribazole phosphatase family protein [Flammeovirga agarivorans]NLR94788.1 alpha-ribazole phosphatase family protein [Flammeovirga agarivorans]
MDIYLVRHTTPNVDAGKTLYGQTDLELIDSFQEEAKEVQHKIGEATLNTTYYSPLIRCKQLAKYLRSDLYVPDERLKEIHYGDWEMKQFTELKNEISEWSKVFDHKPAPNGESLMDVKSRIQSFWLDCIEYKEGNNIAIVTHGVVMRLLLANFLEMPLKNIFRFQFDFGKVIHLTMNESGAIRIHI